jgi:hypothetical protein
MRHDQHRPSIHQYPAPLEAATAERRIVYGSESGVELQYPARLVWPAPWIGLIPVAGWLVDMLRPRTFVELGVHSGNSYCAFLQAFEFLSWPARCFGIDHWRGDEHSDVYGEDVYTELRAYHDALYGGFSTLIRSTFADARAYFSDGSIDLLHIDGFHTYEAVAKDFADWLPKLSSQAVVLFHDIQVRERGFGVWRFWEEIESRYPTFSFLHSHGLGVAYVGDEPPPASLRALLTHSDQDGINRIRSYFARLGLSLVDRFERRQAENAVRQNESDAIRALRQELDRRTQRLATLQNEIESGKAEIAKHVETTATLRHERTAFRVEAARRIDAAAALERELVALRSEIERKAEEVTLLQQHVAESRAEAARALEAVGALERELAATRSALSRQTDLTTKARGEHTASQAARQDLLDDIAQLKEQLASGRAQISETLAQRDRATLLLRQQMAATTGLQRELAALRAAHADAKTSAES